MPARKATGNDGIAATILKRCSLVLAPCIAVLSDRILKEGVFPAAWKEAIVMPVPKKVRGSAIPGDYRPVSLLPLLSKIVEKHVNTILMLYIDPFLSSKQFGFRRGRATVDAILLFEHFILRGFEVCEKRKVPANVAVVYFDVAKAFDSVPHSILLAKIGRHYHLPLYLLAFLRSYLTGRSLRVKVNNSLSSSCPVTSGVPQGSVLGPSLFLAVINAVAEVPLSEGSQLILFADDMVLIRPLFGTVEATLLQADVDIISHSVDSLGLQLNPSKCNFELISLGAVNLVDLSLNLNGVQLQRVTSYRYLGVDVDDRLSFASHTSRVVLSAKRGIGELCRSLRKWAPVAVFRTAIMSIALPAFFYAIEVWYPPHQKDQLRLERVVKYAARIVLNNFSHDTTYDELLTRMGWRSLSRQVAERQLLSVKKYMEGSRFMPDCVFPMAGVKVTRCSQRLKSKFPEHHLHLAPMCGQRNCLEDKLPAARMRKLWNALDEDLVKMTLPSFKEAISSEALFFKLTERGVFEQLNVDV